jgi:hypothetical protein
MLTQAQFAALAGRARANPLPFMASALTISTKQQPGQPPIMRLALNAPQQKVEDALRSMQQAGLPPRAMVLKARQPGISTYCCGKNLVTKLFQPYAQTITVAHVEDAAEKLFRREKFMVDRLPEAVRPKLKIERKNELLFSYVQCRDARVDLMATGTTGWATGKPIWRGMTIHGCHLSEFAFFGPAASDVLLGVLQSVPESPDSYIVIESTANGMGNTFQEEWARAENGESGFRPVFIAWYELPDAIASVPTGFSLESDEKDLQRAFGLTLQQLQWRRNTLYTKCQGNLDLFNQEYPTTAAEAFLVTGRPAFPPAVLKRMHDRAIRVEPRRGVLDMTQTDPRRQLVVHPEGELAIWKWPIDGHLYVIGADPASGIEGGDYSAAAVLDRTTQEIVAVWHGRCSPIEWAHALMDLATFYNVAMLAPEITGGHGFSVLEECRARGYFHLYQWTRLDRVKNQTTNYFGWMTTHVSRPLLFDAMHYALSNGDIMIWDPATIMELMGCRYIDARAEGEDHDDLAFACCPSDTPVETRHGLKLIAKVKVGDEVLAHDGAWRPVTAVMARKVDEPLTVLDVWGVQEPLRCTAEHPVRVRRRRQSSPVRVHNPEWIPARMVTRGDFVWLPRRPLLEPVDLTPDELYLLGWYLGDGNVTPAGELKIICSLREERPAQRLAAILRRLVGDHPTTWYAGVKCRGRRRRASIVRLSKGAGNWYEVACQNRWLAEWICSWVGPARHKRVDARLRAASNTLPFVMGFLEADGSQANRRAAIGVSQKDGRVLWDVQRLLLDHGVWATLHPGVNAKQQAMLHIGAPWVTVLLRQCPSERFVAPPERILAHPMARAGDGGFWVPVRNVTQVPYDGVVHNFSVEAAESYTAGLLAVHNCMIAWRVHLETPMADGQLPRTTRAEPKVTAEPTGPPLSNSHREVWDQIDKEAKQHRRAPLQNLEALVVTDQELQAEPEEVSAYEGPPGGWW